MLEEALDDAQLVDLGLSGELFGDDAAPRRDRELGCVVDEVKLWLVGGRHADDQSDGTDVAVDASHPAIGKERHLEGVEQHLHEGSPGAHPARVGVDPAFLAAVSRHDYP